MSTKIEHPFSHTTLINWSSLREYQKPGWVFRGQKCSTWSLKTSLDRLAETLKIQDQDVFRLELDMLREFRRVYHRYAYHLPVDKMEWLANMQHHGTPTRLLDCTYSIFVAAYFGLEYATAESAVWALNAEWLLSESIKQLHDAGHPDAERLNELFDESHAPLIDRWFFGNCHTECAAPLNSFRLNERLAVQRGVFLFQGNPGLTFEQNLLSLSGYAAKENILQIRIPHDYRSDALRDLFNMNISRASLFPGLDGFAGSLGVYHSLYERHVSSPAKE